ncbi:MAG: hypothetical protein CO098_19885, partial [Bacteroidetes bacterium CG_4_9_14_3_um_filter_41_19]
YQVSAKINPLLVFLPEDGDVTGGATNNNNGGVVGTLPGNLMVSPTGAAVYNIPIDVPPGVAGMTPQLGLVYNSQGGNGYIGMKWSLSGLSSISRTGTDFYHEGKVDGVDFDDNDKLILDGNRLIPIDNETEYRTEIENFSKIVPHDIVNGQATWFEVSTKNGSIIQYGNSEDSRIQAPGLNDILNWFINKVTDRNGNYIQYHYTEETGMGRIAEISYGASGSPTPIYVVKFNYSSNRPDPLQYYLYGFSLISNSLLETIEIKYANSAIITYELSYNLNGLYSNLQEITKWDEGKVNKFNPTKLEWGVVNDLLNFEVTNILDLIDADITTGDFNGDGKTDIVAAYYDLDANNKKVFTDWAVYYVTGNDGTNFIKQQMNTLPGLNFRHFVALDFDSDGLDDLVQVNNTDFSYFKSIGSGFGSGIFGGECDNVENHVEFSPGDFNGNGISELMLISSEVNSNGFHYQINLYEYNGTSFVSLLEDDVLNEEGYHYYSSFEDLEVIPGDYNGDGKTDLLIETDQNICSVYGLDIENYTLEKIYDQGFNFPINTIGSPRFTGDVNGDGIADIISVNNTSTPSLSVRLFNGKSYAYHLFPDITFPTSTANDDYRYYNYMVSDFNGDGKEDIMLEYAWFILGSSNNWEFKGTYWDIYYSNGTGFQMESALQEGPFLEPFFFDRRYSHCDFNGDGQNDCFVNKIESFDHRWTVFFHKNEETQYIKRITNGLGIRMDIDYQPLTNNAIYTKGTGAGFPLGDVQPALHVVGSLVTDNGVGGHNTTDFLYEGAKVHKQGKGFIGYKKLTTIANQNTANSTKTISTFNFNTVFYFSWLANSITYVKSPSNSLVALNELINGTPEVKPFGEKRIFYYTPRSLTKVKHTGDNNSSYVKSVLSTQYYSEADFVYGNVTSYATYTDPDEMELTDPEQNYDFYTSTTVSYLPVNIPLWLIDRADEVTTKTWASTDGTINEKKSIFQYVTNSPKVETITQIPNNALEYRTVSTFGYDPYGNVTYSKNESPGYEPAVLSQTAWYLYDEEYEHRFLTETKQVLNGTNYIGSYTYFKSTGLVKSSIDLNGLKTEYDYDAFGRLQQITHPDGVVDKNRLFWSAENADNPDFGLFYTWSQRSGEQAVVAFADPLGRVLRTVVKDIKDRKIFADKTYNDMGQIDETSNSHFSATDCLWTSYEYLTTGAIKKITAPTGIMEYTYNGRITTSTNTTLNLQTFQEANAIGAVIKVTDPEANIVYDYYSSGLPKAITTGGVTTYLFYNQAGFKERLVDPNAGTALFDYNPFGQLISQTNSTGHSYSMQYDGLGRLINKTLLGSIEDITTYTYCAEGTNGFGQLQTVSGGNGIQTSYIYDDKSRVIEKSQLIDGKKYDFSYDYNVYGKARNVTWPTGFSIKYRYKNGYLSAVVENNTGNNLWKLSDVNARGQVTQYQLGNGLLTTKGYDDVGFPTTIFTEGGVQDLEYNFNIHSGNLNWRKTVLHLPSGNHTLTENFTYDEDGLNNRLMTWQVAGGTQYSVDYAANGNMNTKSGVGTYLYGTGNDGPNAVSRIKDPDPAYLAMAKLNKQEVTYTGFDKTATIRQYNPANQEQASALEITYGPGQSRRMTKLYKAEGLIKTKIFVDGTFEIEEDANGNLRQLHYINGGDGLFAIYVTDQDGKATMNYIHKDYQGSFETITDNKGTVVERLNFDPWGRRRNATDWTFNNVSETYTFDRGYTGHEHLDVFELINMNGRIYDPRLGRFMSPDPFVQSPTNTQNYNRYSYCINNPLKYTDPSGYSYKPDDWDGKITVFAPYFGGGYIGGVFSGMRPAFGGFGNNSSAGFASTGEQATQLQYHWSMQYRDKQVNQMLMSSRTYANLFNSNNGFWFRGPDKINYNYSIPPEFDNGGINLPELVKTEIFFWFRFPQAGRRGDGSAGGGTATAVQAVSTVNTATGIVVSAAQGVVQDASVGANFIYSISGNKVLLNSVTNGFKYTPYVGLGVTVLTGGYLSTQIDPATNRPYQSLTETGIDIGANIGIIYIGAQYGGWYGAGAAALYIGIKWLYENPNQEFMKYNQMMCFSEGSLVVMGDRSLKKIDSIQIGDLVLTYNFAKKGLEINPVLKIDNPVHHQLIKIIFNNGVEIISTEDHPYYVDNKGWCSFSPAKTYNNYKMTVGKLETSDFCLLINGDSLKKVKVEKIVSYESKIITYNLTKIANSNNYFVNGILVNNESETK